jgi:hypothetical protein
MKTTTLAALAVLALTCHSVLAADAPRIRPVQIVSCDTIPEGLAFDVKPMGYQPGFEIFYLVEGSDLAGIKPESLVIESIKSADGPDIAKKRNGKPACKLGPFPKASDDGKYCVFSMHVDDNQFGKIDKLAIKGSVVVLSGSKREEKTVDLKVTDTKAKKVGPFSIQIGKGEKGFMGMGPANPDSVGVKLTGPIGSVIEAKFMDGNQELQGGYSSDTKAREYTFAKPSGDKLTLALKYWADLKETKAPLGKPREKKQAK